MNTSLPVKYLKFDVQLQNYKLQLAKVLLLQPTHFKMCNTYFEVNQSLFPVQAAASSSCQAAAWREKLLSCMQKSLLVTQSASDQGEEVFHTALCTSV